MKRVFPFLVLALLVPLYALGEEPPELTEEETIVLEELTPEDLELLQDLDFLEMLDMLRDMETVARLEDES